MNNSMVGKWRGGQPGISGHSYSTIKDILEQVNKQARAAAYNSEEFDPQIAVNSTEASHMGTVGYEALVTFGQEAYDLWKKHQANPPRPSDTPSLGARVKDVLGYTMGGATIGLIDGGIAALTPWADIEHGLVVAGTLTGLGFIIGIYKATRLQTSGPKAYGPREHLESTAEKLFRKIGHGHIVSR